VTNTISSKNCKSENQDFKSKGEKIFRPVFLLKSPLTPLVKGNLILLVLIIDLNQNFNSLRVLELLIVMDLEVHRMVNPPFPKGVRGY